MQSRQIVPIRACNPIRLCLRPACLTDAGSQHPLHPSASVTSHEGDRVLGGSFGGAAGTFARPPGLIPLRLFDLMSFRHATVIAHEGDRELGDSFGGAAG